MESKPLISFVMPTKNRIAWMPECLQGLLAQSEKNIEIIVVNDGSNDGTFEFLEFWAKKDKRVRVIHNNVSLGGGVSRNLGMNIAESDIIGVCDDDDIYPIERAELILKHFEQNKDSHLVNFPYIQIGYYNEEIEKFEGQPFDHKAFVETGQVNYFANPTVAYKKKSVEKMGGYGMEDKTQTDDIQFLRNWVKNGNRVDFQPNYFLCYHRVLPSSMMSQMRGFNPKWVSK